MFRRNHHHQGAHYMSLLKLQLLKQSIKIQLCILIACFNNCNLRSSSSALPDEGDYAETCWSCFNVNFNTHFKAILLCISW